MNLLGKSIVQLQKLISNKKISEQELYRYFIKRIKKYNPTLNAYLTVVDLDQMQQRTNNGSLKGIPLAIKDSFLTKGIRTTASSKVLDDFIAPYESTVTQKLMNAGCLILGKTNMDAWGHGSSTETSDYGPTKNPWDLSRVAGGSSGGSAAAVSSYLAPAAIGAETAGSIRGPAAWCGLVGLKPTYGMVSRYGLIAMGSSLDCPGPITLTVEDTALILGIISGKDYYDATTSLVRVPNYLDSIKTTRKFTIGITDEYFDDVENEVKDKVENCIKILKKQGHNFKKIKLMHPKFVISVYTIIQRSEVSSNLARYDGIKYGNNRNFFAAEAKRRLMLGTYTLSYGYYDAYYKKAQKVRRLIIENFKKVFREVDVIIAPTMPTTAVKMGEFEKYPFFGEKMDVLTEPATVAGLPAISFPAGLDSNNLPVAVQLIGNYFAEEKLIKLSYQFEKKTNFFGIIERGINNYPD